MTAPLGEGPSGHVGMTAAEGNRCKEAGWPVKPKIFTDPF